VRQQLTLSGLWFALNFQSAALLQVVVPAQILLFVAPGSAGNVQQATFLGWLSALGSLVALLVQPVVGALSDRTQSRLGRRRPYILLGGAVLLVGVAGLAVARAAAAFVAGFLVVQVGSNVVTAAYQGLLPDRVPAQQRGTASGYLGLMTILGNVGSLAVAGAWLNDLGIQRGAMRFYLLSGLVLIVGLGLTVAGIREGPSRAPATVGASLIGSMRRLWLEPWHHDNFRWVFLTRAFVMLGLTLFLTFIEYFFAQVAHITNFVQSTAELAVLALGGAVIGALTLGMLSDRVGRVRLVSVATLCMTLAALTFVIAPDVPLWPLGLLFGVGYGAYTSVDWALAVDSLPEPTAAGKDLGLWSIASTLPAVIAPLVGSLMITAADATTRQAALGYRAVFALAAVCLLLGAVFVLKIQEARGQAIPAPYLPS
jgi:MFS family permease